MENDKIRVLPDGVANQIAAGEVVGRPASVVKELMENAVDAGSTVVTVNYRDGGKSLIQVVDNGCGMSDTDARLAFERHAPSARPTISTGSIRSDSAARRCPRSRRSRRSSCARARLTASWERRSAFTAGVFSLRSRFRCLKGRSFR